MLNPGEGTQKIWMRINAAVREPGIAVVACHSFNTSGLGSRAQLASDRRCSLQLIMGDWGGRCGLRGDGCVGGLERWTLASAGRAYGIGRMVGEKDCCFS